MKATVNDATITHAGIHFAWKMNHQIGTTAEIQRIASLLHRHAATYDHIQEAWCDDDMGDRRRIALEAREAAIETRINDLVGMLPDPDSGPWKVQFSGDPRGYTVRLVTADGSEYGIYEGKG